MAILGARNIKAARTPAFCSEFLLLVGWGTNFRISPGSSDTRPPRLPSQSHHLSTHFPTSTVLCAQGVKTFGLQKSSRASTLVYTSLYLLTEFYGSSSTVQVLRFNMTRIRKEPRVRNTPSSLRDAQKNPRVKDAPVTPAPSNVEVRFLLLYVKGHY